MNLSLALLLVPAAGALAAFTVPSDRARPLVLVATAAAHLGLTIAVLAGVVPPPGGDWLWLDPPGRIVLGLVSLLFFGCAVYAVGYLQFREGRPNRVFVACLGALLGTITLAILARHLGLMWVAIEGSALAAAPLIYFNNNARSIEATWKYLLVGSVGVALALLGTFFLAYAAIRSGANTSLRFDDLAAVGPQLSTPWLKAAFVLLLVGYGTKMGLAPMHTWKPDAYGEAPGLAGALLAGGVTSAAFLAILRVLHICHAAGEGPFANRLLILLGLVSMGVAGALMVGQKDFKRMLAYSSVEHMGILALGIGIGGLGAFGAMLHLVCNGLTKGVLFLSAANLHRAYGSKSTDEVSGTLRRVPLSGSLFLVGFFAITGAPPFGPFLSELTIAKAAFGAGHALAGGFYLAFLMVVFVGMGATVLQVSLGDGPEPKAGWRDRLLTTGPIIGFLFLVLVLGVFIPAPLDAALRDAASWVEGAP
jgi:hydrogenase-4 component F